MCSLGGFLIESGDKKVLVGLGFGDTQLKIEGFVTGNLPTSLGKADARPGEIDAAVCTYMHADHTTWTVTCDALTFGNARHLAGPGEVDHSRRRGRVVRPGAAAALHVAVRGVRGWADNRTERRDRPCTGTHSRSPMRERAVVLSDTIHCSAQLEEPISDLHVRRRPD
ncbi:hypothetical protein GCM10029978_063860 [Actinoallomurus acanthiterrae]